MTVFDALIRAVDALEDRAETYVRLDQVSSVVDADTLERAIVDHVLLVDRRIHLDGSAVTLCRLNRHHPTVVALTSW